MLFGSEIPAQTNTATIVGTLRDPTGAIVSSASVTATNVGTGIQRATISDKDGRYTIVNLAPGHYDLKVVQQGFATVEQRNQELLVGTTITLDFTLTLSSVSQSIEVTSAEPTLSTTQSVVQRVLETEEVDTLPVVNRQFSQLAVMTPGVQTAGVTRGGTGAATSTAISIGNLPNYQVGYVVDGMTIEKGNQGGPYVQLSQDWIQEFSVLTLQFPTEYGAAAGGLINVVTRSGTNKIHGRAYGFFQTAALNANPEFFSGKQKLPFDSQRVGGTVGGPIQHDKLFYFMGFEYFHQLSTGVLGTTPTSGTFAATAQPLSTPVTQLVPYYIYGTQNTAPIPLNSRLAQFKLDYTPNSTNAFIFRSNLEYEYATNNNFGGATTYGASLTQFQPSYIGMIGWTRTLSPRAVNQLQFSYNSQQSPNYSNFCNAIGTYRGNSPNAEPYNYVTTQSLGGSTVFGNPDGIFTQVSYGGGAVVTGGSGGCSGTTNADNSGILQDALSYSKGTHTIKVGGYLRRYGLWAHNGSNQTHGAYTFAATAPAFLPDALIPQTPTAAELKVATTLAPLSYLNVFAYPVDLTDFNFHSFAFGLFAQDSWKVNDNLTLNAGIRYDFSNSLSNLGKVPFPALQTVIPGSHGFLKPGDNPVNNDPYSVAPRAGFALTPFRDNKRTVIRGGFGLFYDQVDTASDGVFITGNSWAPTGYALSANVATRNPYCIGNSNCANGIPIPYQIAVVDVLASSLANYTLPQFPNSTAPCAATNSCTVTVGSNTYTIPALTVSQNPQGNLVSISPNYKTPGVLQTTIGGQHQFTNSFNVAADFVYRRLFNGIGSVNGNIALTGSGASNSFVTVNPAFTTGYTLSTGAYLVAKDLDISASYHDERGDRIQLAYQFGYSNDDSISNFNISALNQLSTNPFNFQNDYGPSNSDARHLLTISGGANLTWGLLLAPIVTYTSALPYTATSSVQAPGTAGAPPGCEAYFTQCYPAGYSRNSLRGDGMFTLASRLSKTVPLGKSRSLEVLFEGFNLTNQHFLSNNFLTNVDNPATFRRPNGTQIPTRQFQFGGRFNF